MDGLGQISRIIGEKRDPNKIYFILPDSSGHLTQSWDRNNPEDVNEARRTFNRWKDELRLTIRYVPEDEDDESSGRLMTTFDVDAEAFIGIKQHKGG